ncbi:MAG: RedB protein [bacterium]|nr:RedB protein [bacterium]
MRSWCYSRAFLLLFGLAWVAAVSAGMGILTQYETAPGDSGEPPAHWPERSRIPRMPKGMTLVMAAHPRCPCTRASIEELARVVAVCQGLVATHVVFVLAEKSDPDWTETDLWLAAGIIPGVQVHADPSGREASLFGAATSGHALLYDAEGTLRFSSGITGSRGHAGDNTGRWRVVDLIQGRSSEASEGFVFGCSLF